MEKLLRTEEEGHNILVSSFCGLQILVLFEERKGKGVELKKRYKVIYAIKTKL